MEKKLYEVNIPDHCSLCKITHLCKPFDIQLEKMKNSEYEQIFDVFGEMRLKNCIFDELFCKES